MLVRSEQLAAHLTRGLQAIYVVYGDAPLLVIEAADAIRSAARQQGFDEREVLSVLPGFDWQQLNMAASNLSLFGGRKLIDLRIPSGKPGREGAASLQAYVQGQAQRDKGQAIDTLLLISLPNLDWREEKAAWLTALGETGVLIKVNAPGLTDLPNWIAQRLQRQNQQANTEALTFIAERVEGNLLAAQQEIHKLGLLFPPGTLSLSQVREAVLDVARFDLETLREALLMGDVNRLSRTLSGLEHEGEAPPLVLWAMTEEIRTLLQLKQALARGLSSDTAFKEARVWGARQSRLKLALSRLSSHQIQAALTHTAQMDRLIKGLSIGDIWNEFLRLGLALCMPQRIATFSTNTR